MHALFSSRVSQLDRAMQLIAAIVILGSIASLVVPFLKAGFPSGHDATAHITYTYLFDRALRQGQFPVRWVEWVRNGESQPLFNFYPPGLYFLIEIVHAIGVRLSIALKVAVVLLWWMGALFTFAWLRPLGRLPAGVAAALFALSPYVIVDVFVRAAYPELAAMALAPGLLWSIDRLIRSARVRDAVIVACFVGLMLMTHLLSSLIFGPVIAAYAAHRLVTNPRPHAPSLRVPSLLALSALLGVGLAAFYLLPSMSELHHVAIGRMTSGYSDYQRHFVAPQQWFSTRWGYGASVAGTADDMAFQIGPVQWLVIAFALATTIIGWRTGRRSAHVGATVLWLGALLVAMFLMTDRSAALWRVAPVLPYLQFPWRYFMVISIATSALAALTLSTIRGRAAQALIVIALVGLQYALHSDHLRPLEYYPRATMNIDNPRWAELDEGRRGFIERGFTPVAAREPIRDEVGRWTIASGEADVTEIALADHRLRLEVRTPTGAELRINSHDFPGWRAWVDDIEVPISIDQRYGFLTVTLPSGTHRVEFRFTNTPIRTIANAISLASVGLCIALTAIIRA